MLDKLSLSLPKEILYVTLATNPWNRKDIDCCTFHPRNGNILEIFSCNQSFTPIRIQLCLMMMIWSLSFKSIDHTSFNLQIFFKEKNSSFNLRFFFSLQSGSWSKNRDRGKVSMLSCDDFFYTLEFNRLRMFCCRKTSWKIFLTHW